LEGSSTAGSSSDSAVTQLVDHLFRHEAGKMVSTLTRSFGFENLSLAEDVVQDALLQAMRQWPFKGIPPNPSGWLMQVARNRALDVVRRQQNFRSKEDAIATFLQARISSSPPAESAQFDGEIRDDQLRMMFACCHPVLPNDAQVVLTLKTLCGFSEKEIAAAFLTSSVAITKRLVRAKHKIRETQIAFEIPAGADLSVRLDTILQTLYLLFNEGYKASQGDELVRRDLCDEAIRLATLLVEHPAGNQPKTHALLALMLFNAARLSSRADAEGNILLLAQQDRTLWNKQIIDRGLAHLNQSAAGTEFSQFHLEAGIACCHCAAPSYEATDWNRILSLYDMLVDVNPSPVVQLNRAVAVANVNGPAAGLSAIELIQPRDLLENYYLFHAIIGQFHLELKNYEEARHRFRRASELTGLKSEQTFLQRKLKECVAKSDA
jgi:RNA polymerase sigma-70 factor (ECF subfamily)